MKWRLINTEAMREKNAKNYTKIIIFQNFEKQKHAILSHVPRILQSKNVVPRWKGVICSSFTDGQIDTKVKTDFFQIFLQPIIKEGSNK